MTNNDIVASLLDLNMVGEPLLLFLFLRLGDDLRGFTQDL